MIIFNESSAHVELVLRNYVTRICKKRPIVYKSYCHIIRNDGKTLCGCEIESDRRIYTRANDPKDLDNWQDWEILEYLDKLDSGDDFYLCKKCEKISLSKGLLKEITINEYNDIISKKINKLKELLIA